MKVEFWEILKDIRENNPQRNLHWESDAGEIYYDSENGGLYWVNDDQPVSAGYDDLIWEEIL